MKRSELSISPVSETELQGALHEVSNALTVVLGWLGNAREQLPPGPARDSLEIAYAHARRGHRVARRAIGATVSPSGEADSPAVRHAVAVAKEAVLATDREAAAAGVRVAVRELEMDALIEGADDALQILMNLVLNAISFSPPGSEITVGTGREEQTLLFRVSDQGPGVPNDTQDRLFARGHSLRPGGAGVGLAHSHAMAEARGGKLRLLPSERGACFELRWPPAEAQSQTMQKPPSREGLRGLRVLLLEDDAAVMTMVQFGLESRGAFVSAATSAAAFDQLTEGPDIFDAALVDFSPIQHDAARALQKLQAKKGPVPVILISGSAIAPDADLPLAAWVQKPFELGELYDALTEVRARPL